jgi:hypothetical protein
MSQLCDIHVKPASIKEVFEFSMKYLELLHKCFTIFSRVLCDFSKHGFCSNQVFRTSVTVKLVLYCMFNLCLKIYKYKYLYIHMCVWKTVDLTIKCNKIPKFMYFRENNLEVMWDVISVSNISDSS